MELLRINYIKYGLIMSAVTGVCLVTMYVTGSGLADQSLIKTFYAFIAPLVVWFLGIRAYKKRQKGRMTLREGIAEGVRIAVVAGIVSPLLFLTYYTLVPSELKHVRETYRMIGADDQIVILTDMVLQFIFMIIMGFIYGSVISLVLKSSGKKRK